jgi:hypothetical protein
LADATTNANDAVNTGSVSTNAVIAGARAFDGNDYLDCGQRRSAEPGEQPLTLSAWIKPTVISGNAVVSKSYAAAHTSPYYAWVLYTTGSALHCRIDTTAASKGSLSCGIWQHVAISYNGSLITYYIDGESVGTVGKTAICW